MTTYTYDLGAGGIRVVTIDRNACTLDGEPVTQLEALRFMQDANAEGIKPTVTPAPAPLCACGLRPAPPERGRLLPRRADGAREPQRRGGLDHDYPRAPDQRRVPPAH
jgi:hypothetical protein